MNRLYLFAIFLGLFACHFNHDSRLEAIMAIEMKETSEGSSFALLNDKENLCHFFHHSEPQRQAVWKFVSQLSLSENKDILFFGSIDGKISADFSKLIHKGDVLSICPYPEMISFAKKKICRKRLFKSLFWHSQLLTSISLSKI